MKKNAKRLSIILMLALIFTSIEFMGVFAVDNASDEGAANDTELSAQSDDPVVPTSDQLKLTAEDPASGVAQGGYRSVILKWKRNDYATKYVVTGFGKTIDVAKDKTSYTFGNLDPLTARKTFTVKAVYEGSGKVEGPALSDTAQPVRTGRYVLNIKKAGTLKKHGGSGPKKYKLKKGTIVADRFQTGKYIFDYNGSTFYIARTRVGKKKFDYTTSFNYTRAEAENYINGKGVGSKTGVIIWVNTYTQHVYRFGRSGGRWVCSDDWECSTGTASTPTPSGTKGMKTIHKKKKKSNGIKWWSKFNGNAALHGRKKGKKVGKPASNGCVRNPDEKAYWIYKYAAKGSRVHIY